MPVAAITGATGFIGRVIAARLINNGWQVRALARSADGQRAVKKIGATPVPGDLQSPDSLHKLITGADAVVHCAGVVRGANYRDFEAVNVNGTAALLRAMPNKRIPVVLLSSLAAREPGLSHYSRSKQAMEGLLGGALAPNDCLILRPPPVYGPGDRELMPLFQAFAKGLAPLPAPGGARVSLLYVDDLAEAVLTWLQQTSRASGVYELHDGNPQGYTWDEIVATAEELLGRRIRKIRLPGAPLQLWGHANAYASRIFGYSPMLTPGKVRELRHANWACDNAGLERNLDWQPRVLLRDGLQLTCGWGQS